jgi:hypothetical protein
MFTIWRTASPWGRLGSIFGFFLQIQTFSYSLQHSVAFVSRIWCIAQSLDDQHSIFRRYHIISRLSLSIPCVPVCWIMREALQHIILVSQEFMGFWLDQASLDACILGRGMSSYSDMQIDRCPCYFYMSLDSGDLEQQALFRILPLNTIQSASDPGHFLSSIYWSKPATSSLRIRRTGSLFSVHLHFIDVHFKALQGALSGPMVQMQW